jgi:hypothetical protein
MSSKQDRQMQQVPLMPLLQQRHQQQLPQETLQHSLQGKTQE